MNSTQPTATAVAEPTDDLSAREVLDLACSQQAAESLHNAASYSPAGIEHEEAIAGQGCPAVAEFCIAEFGTVLGISTVAAKRLIGHALELRHRLPRLWSAVHAGQVPPWRARLVAEATIHATPSLTPDSVGWIDRRVTPFAAKVGPAQLDRLVAEAIQRQHPTEPVDPDDPHPECPDTRHVTVDGGQVGYAGTLQVSAEVDPVDRLDLDHVLSAGAAELKALGSEASLDARRSMALGHLARHQLALDLATGSGLTTTEAATGSEGTVSLPAARALELHLHFKASPADAATGGLVVDHLGRMDEGQRLLLLDLVKSWCGDSHTKVTVKP
ncbi:13E12 repeat family protein [Nocardioides sp. B-3]|uniref:13E12 repeat family protein n=1 Tax=Nocardioides sp. B-3 TaxID=2895565 RepID=UPI0021537417|nr:13E12 repeat family protein [Nocardioides sp. B-3]UUZ59361.1 13E12 repeat family protein [Nocardioides sp. B-3]